MGSYLSYNSLESRTSTAPPKRSQKWVKFSGTNEELARIALDHAKYQACKRHRLLTQIKLAMSRRNGFNNQEPFDTVSEHWAWGPNNLLGDTLALQAVNCSKCGDYIMANQKDDLPNRIKCFCQGNLRFPKLSFAHQG